MSIPPAPAQAYFLKELERACRRAGLPIREREEMVVISPMGTCVAER